jgi:hypothetical protein
MRYGVAIAYLVAVALPAVADDSPGGTPPPAKDAKKYVDVGSLAGKLQKVNTTTSEMVVSYRAGLGRYVKNEKKELTLADTATVWFKAPPQRIDENGDPKKFTPAELDKMKSKSGPTKGLYAGELADLHPGQQVVIVLGKEKGAVKKPAAKDKGAAAEKEYVYVTRVVVAVDDKPPAKPDKKK